MNKPCVLLVDDHAENLLAFESLLEDFDVELLQARSGEEALGLLLRHEVALVILDIQMPGMDGYEVASLMRGASHSRRIPIIFVTAINRDMEQILKGYETGAADVLTKPIEPLIFRSKVQVFLELDRKSRELAYSHQALEASLADVRRLKEYNEMLLGSIGEGIISLDSDGLISYANPAALTLLGLDSHLVGRQIRDFVAATDADDLVNSLLNYCLGDKRWEGVVKLCRRGQDFPAEITATPFHDGRSGDIVGISVVFEDITEREERERELIEASEMDALTGLTNRRGFERILDERLRHDRNRLCLLFIDLDGFKPINDELGHQAGDDVLSELARRFKEVTRDSDLVARLGGDEFCVLARIGEPEKHAATIAEKLLTAAHRNVPVGEGAVTVGASVGIALPAATTTASELVACADRAMYKAKRAGGDRHVLIHCHH